MKNNEKELTFDFESGEIIEKIEEIKVKPVIEKPSIVTEPEPVDDEENEDVEESEDKPEGKKPTIPATKSKTYKDIKVFRYGATDIYNEIGIDENTEYTEKQLIDRLNANGYYEFKEGKTNFAYNEERGILAVTIQGNSKG
jgi:hypothetical protein